MVLSKYSFCVGGYFNTGGDYSDCKLFTTPSKSSILVHYKWSNLT